jgi:hypothetical protein
MLTIGDCLDLARTRFADDVRRHDEFRKMVARLHGKPPPEPPRVMTGKELGSYLINLFADWLKRAMIWHGQAVAARVFALVEEMLAGGDDEVKTAAGAFLDDCALEASVGEMPWCGPYLGPAGWAYFQSKPRDTP